MSELDYVTREIISAAIKVYNLLGPGLYETVYEKALLHELLKRGLKAVRQVTFPVVYDGIVIDQGYRADLIVEGKVLVEIKSVESIAPIHKKQVITYLRLNNLRTGLIINFNVELLREGISRVFNNYSL